MKLLTLLAGSLIGASALAFNPGFYEGEMEMNILAKEGHGGKAVVCRDETTKEITSAEIQDFFEARIIWGRKIQKIEDTEEYDSYIYNQVLPRLAETLAKPNRRGAEEGLHQQRSERLFRSIRFIDGGRLKPIPDSLEVTLPKNCKLEQAAVYIDKNLTLVDLEIWKAFDTTNRVGILMHEYFYYFLRTHGEKDSRRTRKFLGKFFSNEHITPVYEGLEKFENSSSSCFANYEKVRIGGSITSKNIEFEEGYDYEKGDLYIFIGKIFGQLVLSQKRVKVDQNYIPGYIKRPMQNIYPSSDPIGKPDPSDYNYSTNVYVEFESDLEGGDEFLGNGFGNWIDEIGKIELFLFGYSDPDRQIMVNSTDAEVMCSSGYSQPLPIEPNP